MGLQQRANWLEKKLARFKATEILKVVKSGMLLQMPWTDHPLGLSPACSAGVELHSAARTLGAVIVGARFAEAFAYVARSETFSLDNAA